MRADVVGRAFLMLGWLGFPIAQAQATMPVAVAQAQPKGDPVARLEALKSMLDRGMVTQQEFDAKKADGRRSLRRLGARVGQQPLCGSR